jgi:hypothetical protein
MDFPPMLDIIRRMAEITESCLDSKYSGTASEDIKTRFSGVGKEGE